jgi:hypothetical protein
MLCAAVRLRADAARVVSAGGLKSGGQRKEPRVRLWQPDREGGKRGIGKILDGSLGCVVEQKNGHCKDKTRREPQILLRTAYQHFGLKMSTKASPSCR